MRLRQNINNLTPDELVKLKRAFLSAQEDLASPYEILAGIHGLPQPISCPHQLPTFLPWHRKYILEFENLLQRHEPDVTLPFWDWANDPIPNTPGGLPAACQPQMLGDVDVNPLSSAPMRWVRPYIEAALQGPPPSPPLLQSLTFLGTGSGWTRRDPGPAADLHAPHAISLIGYSAAMRASNASSSAARRRS